MAKRRKNYCFDEQSNGPDEAMAPTVDKRKFLLKQLLEDQGRVLSSDDNQSINSCEIKIYENSIVLLQSLVN